MKVKIEQQDDDYVIVIPEMWIEQLGLHDSDEIELSIIDGALTIAFSQAKKPKYRLEDLLEGITEENLHGETDFGAPVGDEVW